MTNQPDILTIDEMEKLVNEHSELYGTDINEDYNSMESSKIAEVTIIYSKKQPRINQKTGKNLKYFPKLYLFFHNESIWKMIRPEKYQFNWKPKTKSKEDLKLVKDLEKLVIDLDLTKTQLTRKALVKYCNEIEK